MLDHRSHDGALLLDGPGPQRRRVHRRALGHQPSEVELALRSPLQTDDHEPTTGCEDAHVVLEVLRADDVQHHIHTLAIGEVAGSGDPVVLAVVDRGVRSERQAGVHLALAAARDDRPGTEQRSHLDRHRPDSGAPAVDEDGLPFPQTGDHHQVGPDRAGNLGKRSRLHQRDSGRHGHHLDGGNHDALGVPAARQECGNVVADPPALDRSTHGRDPARALQARVGRCAGRRWVVTLPLQQVGAVDAGRNDIDHDLIRPRLGFGDVGQREYLGPTRA